MAKHHYYTVKRAKFDLSTCGFGVIFTNLSHVARTPRAGWPSGRMGRRQHGRVGRRYTDEPPRSPGRLICVKWCTVQTATAQCSRVACTGSAGYPGRLRGDVGARRAPCCAGSRRAGHAGHAPKLALSVELLVVAAAGVGFGRRFVLVDDHARYNFSIAPCAAALRPRTRVGTCSRAAKLGFGTLAGVL